MARRSVPFLRGEYYHIYNRGCNREEIFRSDENYRFLLRRVGAEAETHFVTVIAYCLMPNHYHFLLRQDGEILLNAFVQAVFNSYTKAFNRAYHRTGTLFEGPFESIHVNEEGYLIHLCRYIHRNPLEAGLVDRPSHWPYSNYLEWIGKRQGRLIDRQFVRANFRNPQEYEEFVLDYVSPKKILKELDRYLFNE